jgi:Putative peptidoglycan binding domain
VPALTRIVAVAASAVLGVVGGVAGGTLLDSGTAAPDPLGLGVPLVDQACTGKSVLVTETGTSQAALSSAVSEDPDHTRYLRVDRSCSTVWRQHGKAARGYAAYLGPYDSVAQACQDRMTVAHRGDVVTRLEAGSTAPLQCLCYLDYTTFPTLRVRMDVTPGIGMYVRGLQHLLVTARLNRADHVNGLYDDATIEHVMALQGQKGLRQSGIVDSSTWHALLGKVCHLYGH